MFIYNQLCFAVLLGSAFCQLDNTLDLRIQYYGVDESERGLPHCGNDTERLACSTLHRRWWTSDIGIKLCRCPRRRPCPLHFEADPFTLFIDNRSQFKFCYTMSELAVCEEGKVALVANVTYPLLPLHHFDAAHHANLTILPPIIKATCNCPRHHYYRLIHANHDPIAIFNQTIKFENGQRPAANVKMQIILATYSCDKLKRCRSGEFCGFSRADINSIYYRCSCPRSHMCIHGDSDMEIVNELLYVGMGRRAYCQPYLMDPLHDYDDDW